MRIYPKKNKLIASEKETVATVKEEIKEAIIEEKVEEEIPLIIKKAKKKNTFLEEDIVED